MKKRRVHIFHICVSFALFLCFGVCTNIQASVFDGTKISINATSTGGVPSITYLPDDIYLPYSSTGFVLTNCPGLSTVSHDSVKWTVTRSTTTGYWCFQSTQSDHTIYYNSSLSGENYKWLPNSNSTGFQNVKDFGAVGDGATDDTAAVKNAVHYLGSKQGGTLYFPKGDFRITGTINLPPAILIQGSMGKATSTFTNVVNPNSPTRITLDQTSTALFRIGENNENIRIKNIELRANSTTGTYGVEALGKLTEAYGGTTQMISFDNVVFSEFDRGIYVHDVNNNGSDWQFDYVKVESCYFYFNKTAGIYINLHNSDWNIISSYFLMPPANNPLSPAAADAIYINKVGAMMVQNTFGGGLGYDSRGSFVQGGDFIDANEFASLSVINSASERATNSIVVGNVLYTGNFYHSMTLMGNVFGDPISLQQRVRLTSTGNTYGGGTVNSTDSSTVIYSMGDRFCYDAITQGSNACGGVTNPGFQGVGRVIFQTGQPVNTDNGATVPAINATIGNDVDMKGRVNLSVLTLTQITALASPTTGAMVYCSNCNTGTSPCTSGGSGALAVHNGTAWACK